MQEKNKLFSLIQFSISAFCITTVLIIIAVCHLHCGIIDKATFNDIMLTGLGCLTFVGCKANFIKDKVGEKNAV